MGVGICLGGAQALFDIFRGGVLHDAGTIAPEAGIVVPAHADMGKIGEVKLRFQPLPLGLDVLYDFGIGTVFEGGKHFVGVF